MKRYVEIEAFYMGRPIAEIDFRRKNVHLRDYSIVALVWENITFKDNANNILQLKKTGEKETKS